jgi:hypothetical protein
MNSLYALTNLPSSIVRKIWYYTGIGTRSAIFIRRIISSITRRERSSKWVENCTIWNIYRRLIDGIFSANNPQSLSLVLWYEIRVIMTIVIKKNGLYLNTLPLLIEKWKGAHKSKHNTIFNGEFHNKPLLSLLN